MRIGIIDADLLGRKKHRFPNLACEKISGYYKDHGHSVELVLDYNGMFQQNLNAKIKNGSMKYVELSEIVEKYGYTIEIHKK